MSDVDFHHLQMAFRIVGGRRSFKHFDTGTFTIHGVILIIPHSKAAIAARTMPLSEEDG
jgi:hypothetical protein